LQSSKYSFLNLTLFWYKRGENFNIFVFTLLRELKVYNVLKIYFLWTTNFFGQRAVAPHIFLPPTPMSYSVGL